jgi:stringent starvation protein B
MAREAVLRFNGSSFQLFTPLESLSIYARDGGNTCKSRSTSSLLSGVKALLFL